MTSRRKAKTTAPARKAAKKKVVSKRGRTAANRTRRLVDMPVVALPHDTPVETPRVELEVVSARPPRAEQVLARLHRAEGIESGYELWQEMRREHAAHLQRLADERRKLDDQGEFLVGAVRAARDVKPSATANSTALAVADRGLDGFLGDARAKLDQAHAALEKTAAAAQASWAEAFAAIRGQLRDRVRRTLLHVRPKLKMSLRTLGGEKRILHLDRVSGDDAVLLCSVFCDRLPTRYGFLFDDSTDDQHRELPTLYAEEGVTQVRPDAQALKALVTAAGEVLPLKAIVPLVVQNGQGDAQLVRFVERGPVMEAELEDGAGFRNVLSRDEAERIAGTLLRLKLEQRIELEMASG